LNNLLKRNSFLFGLLYGLSAHAENRKGFWTFLLVLSLLAVIQAKQTWRMTRSTGGERPRERRADSKPAANDFIMDLVTRVQKELAFEEKCLKISFIAIFS